MRDASKILFLGQTPIDICDNGKIHHLLSTFVEMNKEN